MDNIEKIFFASGNEGKIREAVSILSLLSIDLLTSADVPGFNSPEETGASFIENARIKAREGFQFSGIPTFAEDAGLEVEELGNEPGIYSSRYKGNIPQAEKNLDIIQRLDAIPEAHRRARFHSVIVFLYGDNNIPLEIVAEGLCHGIIADKPRGSNGFGYDPIFYIPEQSCTFGEIPAQVKNLISHRKNALEALKERIRLLTNLKKGE
ncbi:RdgB/HAM1 family non-canonical purine NTP pyrophosphatase [Planctomycetota bacterium]